MLLSKSKELFSADCHGDMRHNIKRVLIKYKEHEERFLKDLRVTLKMYDYVFVTPPIFDAISFS